MASTGPTLTNPPANLITSPPGFIASLFYPRLIPISYISVAEQEFATHNNGSKLSEFIKGEREEIRVHIIMLLFMQGIKRKWDDNLEDARKECEETGMGFEAVQHSFGNNLRRLEEEIGAAVRERLGMGA